MMSHKIWLLEIHWDIKFNSWPDAALEFLTTNQSKSSHSKLCSKRKIQDCLCDTHSCAGPEITPEVGTETQKGNYTLLVREVGPQPEFGNILAVMWSWFESEQD